MGNRIKSKESKGIFRPQEMQIVPQERDYSIILYTDPKKIAMDTYRGIMKSL